MTTEQTTPSAVGTGAEPKKGSWLGAVWVGVALVLLALIAANARMGAVSRASATLKSAARPGRSSHCSDIAHWLGLVPDLHDLLDARSSSPCTCWRGVDTHAILCC